MVVKSSLLFLYLSCMFEIRIIETGYIMADGGAMFGAVPKRAWQRQYPSDENNLCPLVMRCMLAISDDRVVLIDTGMGNKDMKKIAYYQPQIKIDLLDALKGEGFSVEDITDVILTHLHFDHCGYATSYNNEGQIIPTFPHAKYWLSREQWETYLSPNRLEVDSIFEENIQPIYDAGQLNIIDTDINICEGIELRLFDGHTNGQIVVFVKSYENIYTFPGDLIPTSSHVALEWISAYDICALSSMMEKERFLKEAEEQGYILVYCHDVKTAESKVKKLNDNYKAIILKN